VAHREHRKLHAPAAEEAIAGVEQGIGPLAPKTREGRLDFAAGAGVEEPCRGCMTNIPRDVHQLLAWLACTAPVQESQLVAHGFDRTLDKALMLNMVDIIDHAVWLNSRGRAALCEMPQRSDE